MEWWSSLEKAGNISKIALSALKNAQQKIDSVLDIQDSDPTAAPKLSAQSIPNNFTESTFSYEDNPAVDDSDTKIQPTDDFNSLTLVVDRGSRETLSSEPRETALDPIVNIRTPPIISGEVSPCSTSEISPTSNISCPPGEPTTVIDPSLVARSSSETDLRIFADPISNDYLSQTRSAFIVPEVEDLNTPTTGSDIEVLSGCTSTNGESVNTISTFPPQSKRGCLLAPSVPILRKSSDCIGQQKADLHTFDAPSSLKNKLKSHRRAISQDLRVGPSHPNEENLSCALETLSKNYADKKDLLKIREAKILQLIQENLELQETNTVLQSQLTGKPGPDNHLSSITSEFAERMSKTEQQLHSVMRERDQLKSSLRQSQQTSAKTTAANDEMFMKRISELEQQLTEKTEQLEDLFKEGEQMSRQQLKVNNVVKKLRRDMKDAEEREHELSAKVEQLNGQLQQLQTNLATKDNMLNEQTVKMAHLHRLTQTQENELAILKLNYGHSESKVKELEHELEGSLSRQSAMENELKQTQSQISSHARMTESEQVAREACEALKQQLDTCRTELSSARTTFGQQFEQWRDELEYYQNLVAERESHVESLGELLTSAAQPALLQFQNVQSTLNKQTALWEEVEKNWTLRLEAAEHETHIARQAEQTAQDNLHASELKNDQLRHQLVETEEKHANLQKEIDEARSLYAKSLDDLQDLTQRLSDSKLENDTNRSELKRLQSAWSLEKQKYEIELQEVLQSHQTNSLPDQTSTEDSISSDPTTNIVRSTVIPTNFLGFSVTDQISPNTARAFSFPNQARSNNSQTLMEYMQSLVHLKEGECIQLRRNVDRLTETQENLLCEVATLTARCERLARLSGLTPEEFEEQTALKPPIDALDELQQRYDSLLLLHGRVTEENNELRMDLADVKEIYKRQIDMLVQEK